MKNLIDIKEMSLDEINKLIKVAKDIMQNPNNYLERCKHKKLATLFFEASTRTRLSFEAAMLELGGNVIGFSDSSSSSTSKGESLSDTIRTVGCYSDIIVMRHPKEGAALAGALKTTVPIINAGDGGHSHPSQTLTDMLTISCEKGSLDNLTIGICGDLKFGRTVHSLITGMSRYRNVKFVLISPEELKIPEYIRQDILEKNNIEYIETTNMQEYIELLDVLYMTRIQKERFATEQEYENLKDYYILNKEKIEKAKGDLCIMHPLPRVNEISTEIDSDKRACYFKQVLYGKYIRMALILKLLEENSIKDNKIIDNIMTDSSKELVNYIKCNNTRCITSSERDLNHIFVLTDKKNKTYRCKYCETIGK